MSIQKNKAWKYLVSRRHLFCLLLICSWGFNYGRLPAGLRSTLADTPPMDRCQAPTARPVVSKTELILPGYSVGALQLGDTRERALELFGKPTDESAYQNSCVLGTMHWYDFGSERNGIFAYIKEGRVSQIQVETRRYVTAEGITADSCPNDLRHYYPHSRAYSLVGSGSKVNAGQDLIYWVDRQKGIAFELRYDKRSRKRLVSCIFVFERGTDFQPEGCVSFPQRWRVLKPFSLRAR